MSLQRTQQAPSFNGHLGRRTFLRALVLGGTTSALAGFLAACGSNTPATQAPAASAAPASAKPSTAAGAASTASAAPAMSSTAPAQATPVASASVAASGAKPSPIGGAKFTISAITLTYGNPPPTDGPGLKMLNERFNIDFKPSFIPQGSYTEKLSAVIAGGDIPDIIAFFGPQTQLFNKWAAQGAFLPVNDLVQGYQTFSYVSNAVWNAVQVKGKRMGLPQYYPPYALTPSIRQDWLDNLGLKMPTSYDELKQVALAFTNGDPAKDGKKHYGIAVGADINPNYAMGAYWDPGAWFHKDAQGKFLPGIITTATKDRTAFLAELYQPGGITRDFAVLKNWPDVNKEFYSGKAGIFIGAPRGMSQDYMKSLLEIHPDAKPMPIPPFKAADGTQSFAATSGYAAINALSAKLAKETEKVKRIMTLLDFNRKFYPPDQQNPQNVDYDWMMGQVGQGYDMKDGKVVTRESTTNPQGLAPTTYMVGGTAWPPTDDAIDYQLGYTAQPRMGEWAAALQKMWTQSKPYYSPHYGIISETAQTKGGDILTFANGEQTKMITGQRNLNTWDDFVKEYLAMGGQQIIDETNAAIQERDKGQ